MPTKISRGIMDLTNLPKRVKVVALIAVIFTAVLTFLPTNSTVVADRETLSTSKDTAGLKKLDHAPLPDSLAKTQGEGGAGLVEKTAKIVTCPRCRLNSLPLVKKFVYTHAKLFEPKLKVDFILGEDPMLYLYEDGKQVSKIDLAVSKTYSFLFYFFLGEYAGIFCILTAAISCYLFLPHSRSTGSK